MKWKTDGESTKAVREQAFLSRYKSEPGLVESAVSQSYAYCPCRLWLKTSNTRVLTFHFRKRV